MSDVISLSENLTDEEWLAEIEEIGEARGYYERIGKTHSALFLDESLDVLLVSFDTIETARKGSASGIPHGMYIAETRGWSHLSILAHELTWFRDKPVFGFFDRLIDDAFFEDFDKVIFYGHGPSGYAAAAFSVAAPGSTVFAVAPQATLDPSIAPWDDRFTQFRRLDFSSRFGFAPDMLDAAGAAYVIHDPFVDLDAMHAALFRGAAVHRIPFRHAGPRIGYELQQMNILGQLFDEAVDGRLRPLSVHRALRRRRETPAYLRALLSRVSAEGRHYLTGLLCRAVLERKNLPKFRDQLEMAEHRLEAQGRRLPPSLAERRDGTAREVGSA